MPLIAGKASVTNAQVSWSGFLENYNAVTTTGRNELISGRNLIRLNMLAGLTEGRIYISQDVRNNYGFSPDSLGYTLREAWADINFKNSDLRIGRQIVVWGQADGAFIADLISPVDISEFLTRSFDDLRTGVDAISYTRYFGRNSLQMVINPVFKSYDLPPPGSRWDVRPTLPDSLDARFEREAVNTITLRDMQLAARLSFRSSSGTDLNLAVMYWRPGLPAYRKRLVSETESGFRIPSRFILQEYYRPTFTGTMSTVFKITPGLNSQTELAYYHRRDLDYLPDNVTFGRINELLKIDPQGLSLEEILSLAGEIDFITRSLEADSTKGLLRQKPLLSGMTGLRFSRSGWLMSAQYLGELIMDYDSQLLQDKFYHSATLLMQRSFRRDTMTLRTFVRYNFNGDDFWVNPEWQYDVSDGIDFRVGGHFFGGLLPSSGYGHVHFQNFAANSFLFGSIRAYW
ncbi:MAG: DUF1302 family protein [Cyclonatronaceae bacterium]